MAQIQCFQCEGWFEAPKPPWSVNLSVDESHPADPIVSFVLPSCTRHEPVEAVAHGTARRLPQAG